jgi:signal transduction histidine kinase
MNSKGIGLGLYICKKIVTEFGGVMDVVSEYQKGSKFSFTMNLSENSRNQS